MVVHRKGFPNLASAEARRARSHRSGFAVPFDSKYVKDFSRRVLPDKE
ncbi:hypothetical protein EYZ11_002135 [Aspergillus tanneri]|uniref:Uncharacterized protein n=1 Tax=Aspergillus tanneri TaxID=1220188 RepID=A0A4V3UQA9_9EURO|nr:hypothetical protein EYZ11_002135 [Aspergillus tanneri]